MVRTIHVSESFHSWVKTHKKEGETMEDTLRRLIGVPHPQEVAEVLSEEQVDEAEEAIEELHERDSKRLREVQEAVNENSPNSDLALLLAKYDREKHRKIYDDLANE